MHFAARKVSSPINVSDLIIPPDIFGKIMKYVQEDRSNLIKRESYIRKRLADLASKGSLVGNIVIFGAGGYTKDILEFPELKGVEIKYIVDNNRDKQGTVFYNLPVYPVEKIDKQIKKIIISSFEFEEEIFKQLLKMGINEDRIIKLYS